MANEINSQQPTIENQIVGRVMIVNGSVQAQAPGSEIRNLAKDSQIYANDRIITGEEGSISIVFLDPGQTQLDLGRMSDMVISEDVFQVGFPTDLKEATADVEQIQEALLSGEFDPTIDLEATAAGPAAGGGERGGGRTIVRFDAEGREVTPDSGAETENVGFSFAITDPTPVEALEIAPAFFAATFDDGGGGGDPIQPTLDIDRVVEEEAMNIVGRNGLASTYYSRIQEISGEDSSSIDHWHFTVDPNSDPNSTSWIRMNFQSEGQWPYPDLDSDHADGSPDQSDLRPDVHIYEDDGSGGLGAHVQSWISGWDPNVGISLTENTSYILVVGDHPFFPSEAEDGENGNNVDPDPFLPTEHGPYQFTISGNVTITQTPADGYITSKPALSDGNPDQNDIVDDSFQPDSAVVSGNLGDGTWAIIPASLAALPILSSQGYAITYELNNDTPGVSIIEAWVRFGGDDVRETRSDNRFEQEDRLVFTLQVESESGDYEFSLLDQLDNVPPGFVGPDGVILENPDPNAPLAEENTEMVLLDGDGEVLGWVNNLDFSESLQVTFPPGHPSEGTWTFPDDSFTITLVDDIPVAVNGCEANIRILVREDGMASWIEDEGYNDNADQSDGLPPKDTHSDENGDHRASIAQLFKVGADEFDGRQEAVYTITSDSDLLDELPSLWSHGEQVQYRVEYQYEGDFLASSELIAYVGEWPETGDTEPDTIINPTLTQEVVEPDPSYPDNIRIVFTLEVDQDGGWRFDLDDQLDHVDNKGAIENYRLRSGDSWEGEGAESVYGLDLSSILTVTDFDGDTVTGAQEGAFVLFAKDDIPKVCDPKSLNVSESKLTALDVQADDDIGSGTPYTNANTTILTGNFFADGNIRVGADEEVTLHVNGQSITLYQDPGHAVTSIIVYGDEPGATLAHAGQLELFSDGSYEYHLVDNTLLHHTNNEVGDDRGLDDISKDSFKIHVEDFDGDTVTLDFDVKILDDGPSISIIGENQAVAYVHEDALSHDYPVDTLNPLNSNDPVDAEHGDSGDLSVGNLELNTDHESQMVSMATDQDKINLGDLLSNYDIDYGADGEHGDTALQYSVSEIPNGYLSSHTSAGMTIWYFEQDGVLVARAGNDDGTANDEGRIVFTVSLEVNALGEQTGNAIFNLNDQLDHGDSGQDQKYGTDDDTPAGDHGSLNITDIGSFLRVTVMDGDKDTASADFGGMVTVNVENDVPEVIETAQYSYISEYAGYNNAIGVYVLDDSGNPEGLKLVIPQSNIADWAQAGTGTPESPGVKNPYDFDEGGYPDDPNGGPFHYTPGINMGDYPEGTKLFLIADADGQFTADTVFSFRDGTGNEPSKVLQFSNGGTPADVVDGDDVKGVYFMDSQFDIQQPNWWGDENDEPLNISHFTDQWATSPNPDHFINDAPEYGGEVRIEDLNFGDKDFDDTVLRIEKGPVVSEAALTAAHVATGDDVGTGSDPWKAHDTTVVRGNFFVATVAGIQFVTGADESLTLNIDPVGIPEYDQEADEVVFNNDPGGGGTAEITNGAVYDPDSALSFDGEAGTLTIWNNGDWTYQLTDNTLKNPDNDKGSVNKHDGDYDRYAADQAQEVFNITATDFDGDSVSADFIVNINDDGPQIATLHHAILANDANPNPNPETEPSEGGVSQFDVSEEVFYNNQLVADLLIDFGADGPSSDVPPLQLVAPTHNGEPGGFVIDNNGTLLTYQGMKLVYVDDGNGGLIAVTVAPEANSSSLHTTVDPPLEVFRIELHPEDSTYEITLTREIDGASANTIDFTSKALDSGGPSDEEWIEIDKDGDGSTDIKVRITGIGPHNQHANTVDISQQGVGVVDAWVDEEPAKGEPAEILKFEFFDGNDNALSVSKVSFTIDGLNESHGNASTELLSWYTNSNPTGGTFSGIGNGSSDDQEITINETSVFNTVFLEAGPSPSGERFAFSDDHRIENMTIYTEEEAFDSTITYEVVATDADGDSSTTTIDVTFDGEGDIEGTNAAEVIAGGMGNDIIYGNGGDDIIFGNDGFDTIDGGNGDDTITGEIVTYDPVTGEATVTEDGYDDEIDGGSHTDGDIATVDGTTNPPNDVGIETVATTDELENLLPPIEVV